MKREDLVEKILDIKRERGWTWRYITDEIGGVSPTLVVGALLGQMKLVKPLARRAAELFGLTPAEEAMLNEVPYRGTPMPPTDPLIYRFYEMVMVNGPAFQAGRWPGSGRTAGPSATPLKPPPASSRAAPAARS